MFELNLFCLWRFCRLPRIGWDSSSLWLTGIASLLCIALSLITSGCLRSLVAIWNAILVRLTWLSTYIAIHLSILCRATQMITNILDILMHCTELPDWFIRSGQVTSISQPLINARWVCFGACLSVSLICCLLILAFYICLLGTFTIEWLSVWLANILVCIIRCYWLATYRKRYLFTFLLYFFGLNWLLNDFLNCSSGCFPDIFSFLLKHKI